MIERKPFTTANVPEIDLHLQERLKEVEDNFENESYPRDKPREIDLKIVFERDKQDPDEITAKVFSASKLPKRFGKKVNAVLKNGKILVEEGPQEQPLFPTEAQEAARSLKKTLKDAGATMTVVAGGGQS